MLDKIYKPMNTIPISPLASSTHSSNPVTPYFDSNFARRAYGIP